MTHARAMWDECEPELLLALEPMQCACIWTRKNSQGTMTLTTRTRPQKQTSSADSVHESSVDVLVSFHMLGVHSTCCCACCSVLRVTNSMVVNAPNLFTFWPVREFLVEIHTAKMDLWGVVFTPPVGCRRPPSAVNDPTATNEKTWKSHVWGFVQRRQTTVLLPCRFARKLICGLSLNYHELHQESLHCHQLEEDLDDWCHFWYFQNGTGLSCCCPDSWCRRFNLVNASLKSERSLAGPVFARIIERDPPILSVSKVFCLRQMIRDIFLRKFVHLDTDFFSSIMFELRFTKFRIFQESIVNPFKTPLDASLSQIMGNMIISLFFTCVGEGFVSRPHLLGEVHRGSYYSTSGKLKELFEDDEEWEEENEGDEDVKDVRVNAHFMHAWWWPWDGMSNYAHVHVFNKCVTSLLGFMLCFVLFLWILVFTLSLVSDASTSSKMVSFVNCISPRIRNTKYNVLSFWML